MSETEMKWKFGDGYYELNVQDGTLQVSIPPLFVRVAKGGGEYHLYYELNRSDVEGNVVISSALYNSCDGKLDVTRSAALHLAKFVHLLKDVPGLPKHASAGIAGFVESLEECVQKRS